MALSEDETTFLLWFAERVKSLHAAGDTTGIIRLYEGDPLPYSEHLHEASADLVDKGLLKATPGSFDWVGLKGGGHSEWWDLELTEAGKAEVKRLRRWWRSVIRSYRARRRGD